MIITILEFINKNILSPILPALIFLSGILFAFKLRFFNIVHPIRFIKALTSNENSAERNCKEAEQENSEKISPFKALTLALAGTLGVGNIAGVSTAILLGGPGAVFWMWISAFAAMLVKYAEIVLAMVYRRKEEGHNKENIYHGGAMYYIKNGKASLFFALLCLIGSFSLGNIVQIKAATDALTASFKINPPVIGIIAAIITFVIIGGGVKSISDFTFKLIPLLSCMFIAISLVIIFKNAAMIPEIFSKIIHDALNPISAASGISGYILSPAMRYGVTRGLFSNEAGCGTAPIAHAEADTNIPAKQGCFGIFEVFADTILLCTMTALVILISYNRPENFILSDTGGMTLALKAYEYELGKAAGYFISISSAFFAIATIVCWSHYGIEALRYIIKRCGMSEKLYTKLYITVYSIVVAIGAVTSSGFIWQTADLTVGCMTIINVTAIILQCDKVAEETKKYFGEKFCRNIKDKSEKNTLTRTQYHDSSDNCSMGHSTTHLPTGTPR